jgi:hypothetical protein
VLLSRTRPVQDHPDPKAFSNAREATAAAPDCRANQTSDESANKSANESANKITDSSPKLQRVYRGPKSTSIGMLT